MGDEKQLNMLLGQARAPKCALMFWPMTAFAKERQGRARGDFVTIERLATSKTLQR